jgi:uncharacterized protein (DUF608 family)
VDAWDRDCDGVIDGRQHHTLDMELFGANSWLQVFYLLALDCASKMADALGEKQRAQKYKLLFENGRVWLNENLFNGEYFGQKIDLKDKSILEKFSAVDRYWNEDAKEVKYQIGEGCGIDQMLADWHGAILGSNELFDASKKHKALESLYKYNYKPSMRAIVNTFRNFAVNDEAGVVICSYPEHKYTPALPILYLSETMTGFEYALAGLMLSEGFVSEGENIIRSVRDRYDGDKRNPWSELECGHNYARSMASYALLPIYSGFTFDMTKKYIGFDPIKKGDCRYFWSIEQSCGEVVFEGKHLEFTVFEKPLLLTSFGVRKGERVKTVVINGKLVAFTQVENVISFSPIAIESMTIEID